MFDSYLTVCGLVAEAVVALLLLRTRVFRVLPAFFVYVCWSLASDAFFLMVQLRFPNAPYALYEARWSSTPR